MNNNILDQRSQQTAQAYNLNAKAYEQKFMNFGLYNDTFDELLNRISTHANLLELGCGPGNATRYIVAQSPNVSVHGVDVSPEMVKLASSNVPSATFQVMDVRKLTFSQKFDAVLVAFCLPYLAPEECSDLFTTISNLLHLGGYLYLSFMDDDPAKSGFETTSFSKNMPVYIYYHSEEFICDLLENNNFELDFKTQKLYPEPDGTFLTDCILIAKKK